MKKFVLIPLKTFEELCSKTKVTGETITGIVKNETPQRSRKRKKCYDSETSSESLI